jgi:hypothetical protein
VTREAAVGFAELAAGVAPPGEDAEVNTGAQVARWRRYGKDRLYVTAVDGTKIGWRDLLTGEDHLEAPDLEREFIAALATWTSGVKQEPPAVVIPADHPVIDDREPEAHASPESQAEAHGEDLAAHRPGVMAREQALALKNAAPVRTFLARALGVHTDERAWRVGADGEELVAAQLQRLAKKDPRWRFLHAIPVGDKGSDIDHLVVGPGGVFTLNAKHHRGGRVWVRGDMFMVNGQRLPYIRNSRHEAARASRLLTAVCGMPVDVHGVVVPVGADSLKIKDGPPDVSIVNRMALRDWLRRRVTSLSDEQTAAIFEVARRSTTWS